LKPSGLSAGAAERLNFFERWANVWHPSFAEALAEAKEERELFERASAIFL
jgi:hypothetical protein